MHENKPDTIVIKTTQNVLERFSHTLELLKLKTTLSGTYFYHGHQFTNEGKDREDIRLTKNHSQSLTLISKLFPFSLQNS